MGDGDGFLDLSTMRDVISRLSGQKTMTNARAGLRIWIAEEY